MLLFTKLKKGGFVIDTPYGSYSPDWAVVCRKDSLKDSAIGIYFIVETKANSINSLELEILVEKQSEIGGIMKRKNDMFKAFMAYKYFIKEKEEAEERARQENRIEAEKEERKYQLEQMEDALVNSISSMNCIYERLAEESGFYEQVGIGDQMLKDLWTYTLCECISSGILDDFEIESIVERILDRAIVFNEVSVSEHLDNIKYNSEYEEYINNCFIGDSYYPGMFWILLATMSGNEGERVKESIGFTKSYRETLLLLDSYLSYAYPNGGFLNKGDEMSMEMIDKINAFLQVNEDVSVGEYQTQHILNPLIVTLSDID